MAKIKNMPWFATFPTSSIRVKATESWVRAVVMWAICFVPGFGLGQVEQVLNNRELDPWKRIDEAVRSAIKAGKMPGASVVVGQGSKTVYHQAFGHLSLLPEKVALKKNTLFDLASLTKPIATATSVMILVDQGRVRLRDPVAVYLPEFAQNGKRKITVQQLLTHVGGLIPDNPIGDYRDGREKAFEKINALSTTWEPGTRFSYTDVGYLVLGQIIERVTGLSIDQFARKNIFEPLGMLETGFLPSEPLRNRAALTQQRAGRWMPGVVHDPRAYELGGIAGHAGLFSTATDLEKYCLMLLGQGQVNGIRILSRSSVKLMTATYDLPGGVKRGLGWDKLSPYSSNRGELMSHAAFGHGGFTGTSIWMDPELDLYVIFLSNRVHPEGKGSVNRLAGRIGTIAAAYASNQ
ncbi:beta-lactamase family protein [Pirellulaceae bacterium]|jgi:CubicO group peptidase (beta-lactamase class C family)|nr:beta-lactamase family protein [Pirellulaceae bacterium]